MRRGARDRLASNSHRLTIEFLGTGTSQGVPEIGCECSVCVSGDSRDARLRSSLLVSHGDTSVVIDTGPDFRQQALRAGIPRIDAVLYTHTHADHIMGVDDLRQFNRKQAEEIPIYLPRQFEDDFLSAFGYAFVSAPPPLYRPKLSMHLIDPFESISFPGFEVQSIPVMHGQDEISAYVISRDGQRLAYVSECKTISAKSRQLLEGVDVLILGAIWQRSKDHPNHLTLEQALSLVDQLSPKTCYVTHVTHLMGLHQVVNDQLPPHVKLAYDGLQLTL